MLVSSSMATGQGLAVQSEWGTAELVDRIADEWRQLCLEGPCDQPFFRPEWIAACTRAFAPGHRLLLITVRNGGRLRAVLPLLEDKKLAFAVPFTRVRGAANVQHSCRFDLIHGSGPDLEESVRGLWGHLRDLPDWDMVELPIVPEGGAAERLLLMAREDGFLTAQHELRRSPYLLLNHEKSTPDFSHFGRDARFRKNLRRRWRNLEAKGRLSLRRADKADPQDLRQFYRLEQSGWKGKKGTAIACSKETQQFYDSIAQSAERFGYLSFYFLEQNGEAIAAQLGLTCGGRHFAIKSGYDENYEEYGPGHLITGAVLQDCVQRGLSEYDLLGRWEEWKAKWGSEVRPHAVCYIFPRNLPGRLLYADTQLRCQLEMAADKVRSAAVVFRSYLIRKRNGSSP
jgi:CelD/BcsL family acetyltransferase involved in cellulose biosynthesis